MSKAKVLITGADGFAGRHLVPFLREHGFDVIASDRRSCDLSRFDEVLNLFNREHPDFVVHLAAKTSPGRDLSDLDAQYSNTILPAQSVALALPSTTRLAIFVGSIEEYGMNPAPFREEFAPAPISPYGCSKVAALNVVRMICYERDRPFTWLRPSLMYGPGMSMDRFVGLVIQSYRNHMRVNLTPCQQVRDFLYVGDFCESILKILKNPELARNQIFNISTETWLKLTEVLDEIAAILGPNPSIHVGGIPYRNNEIIRFYSSGESFRRAFGKLNATSFSEGFRRTVASELES